MRKTTKTSSGERFRASVAEGLDLDSAGPAWTCQLDQTVALLDLIERLEDEVNGNMTVTGSTGQPVANPLLAVLLRHRVELTKMLSHLGLGEDDESLSGRQRRAANARWNR